MNDTSPMHTNERARDVEIVSVWNLQCSGSFE